MTWKDVHLEAVLATADRLSNDIGLNLVPREVHDEISTMLGNLRDFLRSLERQFEEQRLIHAVTEQANAGIILDEILERIFDSFRPLVPYDRIGLALLEGNGTCLRARWARTDAGDMCLKVGFAASMEGSSLHRISSAPATNSE